MLWETDFSRQQSRLRPDAHIHIISISYASPTHNPKSSHAPRVVLVRGTVLAANVHSDIKRGPVTALFRLSEHTHVRRGAVEHPPWLPREDQLVGQNVDHIDIVLASSGVRGFAFTLVLTTLLDILVVFAFSHPLLTLLARFRFFSEGRRFSGLERQEVDTPSVRYVGAGQVAVRTSASGGEGSSL